MTNLTNPQHPTQTLTFCIVAGEVSGDQLGAGLISALKVLFPHAQFVGIGGDLMRQQGCQTWYDIADLSYFGVVDVVKNLPSILKTIKHTKQLVAQHQCTIYIGIDNPDFNLRVAKYCKQELKIPTVQYVSPSVWAWRQGRVKTIKAAIDKVLCLLPFEPTFYQAHELKASYVGHRLANSLKHLLALDLLSYLQLQQLSANQLSLDPHLASLLPSSPKKFNISLSEQLLASLNTMKTHSLLESSNSSSESLASSQISGVNLIEPKFSLEDIFKLFPVTATNIDVTNNVDTKNIDTTNIEARNIDVTNISSLNINATSTTVTTLELEKTLEALETLVKTSHKTLTAEFSHSSHLWEDIFKAKKTSKDKTTINATTTVTPHSIIDSTLSSTNTINLPNIDEFSCRLVTKTLAMHSLSLSPDHFYLAVLPGSRSSEISLILELFLSGIEQAMATKVLPANTHILIPIAKPKLIPLITEIVNKFTHLPVSLVNKNAHQVLLSSNVALVASGTATLDTLLCHLPMIVGYKLSTVNYFLANKLVKLPYVALSNIVQGQEVSKELIQEELVPEQICAYLTELLQPCHYYATRLRFFKQHLALVTDSDTLAAQQVAELLIERKLVS